MRRVARASTGATTRAIALVLAGGTGSRAGVETPKQLALLGGRPLLMHSVTTFVDHPGIDAVVLVVRPEQIATVEQLTADQPKVVAVVAGGLTRADSSRAGLDAVTRLAADDDVVLIHDAARPFVDAVTISGVLDALKESDAVAVTVPESDTVVAIDGGLILHTLDRETLHRCQTPQAFRLGTIRRAHDLAAADDGYVPTDDCGVVLRFLPDVTVHVVAGSPDNIKVTHPGDLDLAEGLLIRRDGAARTGTPEQ